MGFEADGHREEDHAHIYPIPRTIRSKGRRLRNVMEGHRIAPVSPFMGSIFEWKTTLHFPDLGDIESIESRRDEVKAQIRARVEQEIRNQVNDGTEFSHDLDDDGKVGSTIYADQVQDETDVDTQDGRASVTQRLDMKAHLWHKEGDDPRAALGKAVDRISHVVANAIFEEIDQLRAEEEAVL